MTAIAVVGGTYGEECSFPRLQIMRGSGLRAACILAGLGNAVTLQTVVGSAMRPDLESLCGLKEIELDATAGEDIWFRYRHPVGKPDIYPAEIKAIEQPDVKIDTALIFGMLEGRPMVNAERAVYDPQDGFRAQPFSANGSTAKVLAIVASWSEARAMSGMESPKDAADALLNTPNCNVVIVKCGPQGALIATKHSQQWIQAFPTPQVWKIGSGDVFSAGFTQAWAVEGQSPLESAWFASRLVAAYVASREEVFSPEQITEIRDGASAAMSRTTFEPREVPDDQIYLAAPFFTTSQQWLVEEARNTLSDMGFKVFSPIHEIGEGPANIVAPADLFAIESSKLVFALLDGLDAGTLFEVGYARALGIPVVAVAESVDGKAMTMLEGSACTLTADFATGIYTACWQLMGDV